MFFFIEKFYLFQILNIKSISSIPEIYLNFVSWFFKLNFDSELVFTSTLTGPASQEVELALMARLGIPP